MELVLHSVRLTANHVLQADLLNVMSATLAMALSAHQRHVLPARQLTAQNVHLIPIPAHLATMILFLLRLLLQPVLYATQIVINVPTIHQRAIQVPVPVTPATVSIAKHKHANSVLLVVISALKLVSVTLAILGTL